MLKKIAGCIGFILSLLYYIISTYSFLKLKSDCSKNFQYVKFYKILFNYTASFFNYFYSDVTNYGEMIYCNRIAIFLNLAFLIIYILLEIRQDLLDCILNILLIGITSLTFYHYFYEILVDVFIYGLYFILANLLVLIYFLYENYTEIKIKLDSSLTFYFNIIFTLTSFFWLIYGVLYKDNYIKISFGIEFFFGIFLILGKKYLLKIIGESSEGFNDIINDDLNNNQKKDMDNTIEFEEKKTKKYENI